jgi:F420-non-reducing hydrogenase iron-sulfur subunit
VVKSIGLNPKRLKMEFCSSAEGSKYREVATSFDDEIKKLGPSPLRKRKKNSSEK